MNKLEKERDFLYSFEGVSGVLDTPDASVNDLSAQLIPVMSSTSELESFADAHDDFLIVPYLLYKARKEDLLLSTSSMHMNWLWPNLLYVPVNIESGNHVELRKLYAAATKLPNVIFFNHTIPHKSNPVMKDLFGDGYGDYLTREGNRFVIADGNGQAFVQMAQALMDGKNFTRSTVIIVGVGGAGMLAAINIVKESPKRLILVDIRDKTDFAGEIGAEFYQGIGNLPDLTGERLVIIDATAHFEEGIQHTVALDLVKKYDAAGNVFIDFNMNTKKSAYDDLTSSVGIGSEYAAITNYIMTLKIAEAAGAAGVLLTHITRERFDQSVSDSVLIRNRIKSEFFRRP